MTPYAFVAALVGIVFLGIVLIVMVSGHYSYKQKKLRYEQERDKGLGREDLENLEEIARRLEKLNQRIEALETLAIEHPTKNKSKL